MTDAKSLQGQRVRLNSDRRRKWTVVAERPGGYLRIAHGMGFDAVYKNVRRRDVTPI